MTCARQNSASYSRLFSIFRALMLLGSSSSAFRYDWITGLPVLFARSSYRLPPDCHTYSTIQETPACLTRRFELRPLSHLHQEADSRGSSTPIRKNRTSPVVWSVVGDTPESPPQLLASGSRR